MLVARPFPRKENLCEEKKEDKNKSHKVRLFLRLKEISFTTNIYYLALPGHRRTEGIACLAFCVLGAPQISPVMID